MIVTCDASVHHERDELQGEKAGVVVYSVGRRELGCSKLRNSPKVAQRRLGGDCISCSSAQACTQRVQV